jgi:DNA-binding transcriptional MerR regulator
MSAERDRPSHGPAGPSAGVAPEDGDELLTVDELAAVTGMTVRTTRYYAGLGLLPPPVRRGRMAYYSARHRARLELIRALQGHGFTLAAIEKYLAKVPLDASVQDLALQRAMLTSWVAGGHEVVTRRQLDARAGRRLDDEQVDRLLAVMAVRPVADRFEVLPAFDVGLKALDVDIPVESLVEAGEAIQRHMDELAEELTEILRKKVLAPARGRLHTDADKARFEQTMSRLRELTLQAVVSGFQRAANQVITRSLSE